MLYSDITAEDALVREIHDVICAIDSCNKNLENFTLKSNSDSLSYMTQLQAMLDIKFETATQKIIYDTIMSSAMKAEVVSPHGFQQCINSLLTIWKKHQQTVDVDSKIETNVPTTNELADIISTDSSVSDIVMCALQLAGYNGKIIIEKTPTNVVSVEKMRGYTFQLSPCFATKLDVKSAKILCIDGFIENISEIHAVLQNAHDTKDCVFMFARGFSNDVLNTLSVNFNRSSLQVIPVQVKFDIHGMNMLNDIATIADGDVISSNKGELISTVNYAQIPIVERIICDGNKIVIFNRKSHSRVKQHVRFLQEKRSKEQVDDVISLLNQRIKSLLPNHVVIRIPNDSKFIVTSQKIDYQLRTVKSLIDNGAHKIQDKQHLVATTMAAKLYATKCLAQLRDLGAILLIG